jgi:hypothetical protein
MKRFASVAMFLLLSACSDKPHLEPESPCPDACEGPTPICDEARGLCVACLDDADCEGRCFDERCHECTLATEALDCGETSCDHREAPFACTDTRRGSLGLLDVCRVDSECWTDLGYACVQTYFQGEPEETRCLKRVSAGCERPTRRGATRASTSSDDADRFCIFAESAASGAAVQAMLAGRACDPDADAAEVCGPGGLCRFSDVVNEHRCTVPCESNDDCVGNATEHCPAARICGPGS